MSIPLQNFPPNLKFSYNEDQDTIDEMNKDYSKRFNKIKEDHLNYFKTV